MLFCSRLYHIFFAENFRKRTTGQIAGRLLCVQSGPRSFRRIRTDWPSRCDDLLPSSPPRIEICTPDTHTNAMFFRALSNIGLTSVGMIREMSFLLHPAQRREQQIKFGGTGCVRPRFSTKSVTRPYNEQVLFSSLHDLKKINEVKVGRVSSCPSRRPRKNLFGVTLRTLVYSTQEHTLLGFKLPRSLRSLSIQCTLMKKAEFDKLKKLL